jgi:hypothetical protein
LRFLDGQSEKTIDREKKFACFYAKNQDAHLRFFLAHLPCASWFPPPNGRCIPSLPSFKEAAKRGGISSQVFLRFDLRQVHVSEIAIENACAPSFHHGSRHSPNAVRHICPELTNRLRHRECAY